MQAVQIDDICRLCCATKFVNNHIFDEGGALFLKMSMCLPIRVLKVFKNDRLPQKICDRCSCKIDEYYQFYNKAVEVQHRLHIFFAPGIRIENYLDLALIKQDVSSPCNLDTQCRSTQTDGDFTEQSTKEENSIQVKNEPISAPSSPVKTEDDNTGYMPNNVPSDDSDNTLLINIKKTKKNTKADTKNGENKEKKKGRKRKSKAGEWGSLVPKSLRSCSNASLGSVKEEVVDEDGVQPQRGEKEAANSDVLHCCTCFARCSGKSEMLKHYKMHEGEAEAPGAPAPPPLPDQRPLRCSRCQKVLEAGDWAAHWRRHWQRDRRPLRCALCGKTFRNHYLIYKHGLSHKAEENPRDDTDMNRFVCDLCPEGFIYLRCLLAHRTRAHPEAAARALRLRCGVCARTFAHANSLRRHQRAHSGERNYLCNVCGKALSSHEHLKFHIRIHTGYKPHVCKTCGKGFVKKCNLTLHERVHSGEKPHVCSHCGKAFSQRSTLVIHERYHSGARPYRCALCGRGFVARGLLSMHGKTSCVELPPAPPAPRLLLPKADP